MSHRIRLMRQKSQTDVFSCKRAESAHLAHSRAPDVGLLIGQLTVTRLDRLARSTRDLLNTLAAITDRKAGFRSLGDTWADTTTAQAA